MDRERDSKDISLGQSEVKVIIAGSGGQGILLLGKILAQGLLEEDKNVSWLSSYGAEVRGGTCRCMVVGSDNEISSPCISNPDCLIVMNQPSYQRYTPLLKEDSMVCYNSSLIAEDILNKELSNTAVAATEEAKKLGNSKCANMVMLGKFIKESSLIELETAIDALDRFIKNRDILELDKQALEKGFSYE
ncbi:MAG: 2-oxoacid:acceptor oxidoreductase family protein [Candidatus Kaelpia imicola]|nr:2-oxoacid:acceptor oxidoreductase family protein [Candidatus Kaelpia imicola]